MIHNTLFTHKATNISEVSHIYCLFKTKKDLLEKSVVKVRVN